MSILRFFNAFDIGNLVPDEGITLGELSKATDIHERALTKMMRAAICQGLYCEPRPGLIKHTPTSQLFRIPGIRSLCKFSVDTILPSMDKLVDAARKWNGSEDPGHSAYNIAHNETGPMTKFPDESCFKAIMSAADAKGLQSYPLWAKIDQPGAVFVDVGGNHGYGSLAIAKATSHVNFVVEDMHSIIEKAKEHETEQGGVLVDPQAGHRIQLRPYDLFMDGAQPVGQADVYFLRAIFHNWSDLKCREILRNHIPALKPGAHFVVCDIVMPDRCEPSYEQHYTCISDLAMYALHNAWERTESQWRELFASVHPGFKLVGMHTLWPGSYQRFVDFEWAPQEA